MTRSRIHPKRRMAHRDRRGASLVEMAIVLNVCLLFLLSIFDYGRFAMTRQAIDNASRESARFATVSTETLTTTDIQNKALNCLGGQQLSAMTIDVYRADPSTGANLGTWQSAELGECIAVEIRGGYQPMLPTFSLLPNPIPIVSKAMMRSEAN